jgi:hypothetical protein
MDPADYQLAAQAGRHLERDFARRRYQVVQACLDEIQAESTWLLTAWKSNAASHNDYSAFNPIPVFLKIRLFIPVIRGLAYASLVLRTPRTAALCTRMVGSLRQALQTA